MPSPRLVKAALALALAGATACSAEMETYTSDAESGSTHALISVERSAVAGDAGSARAGALAGFVRMPADTDAQSVLGWVGLAVELPAPGQCAARLDATATPRGAMAATAHLELIDAGNVTLSAGDGELTLAPRAFPTVTDRISGVMYTTRDRSAEPLPAGARYQIRASGGAARAPLAVDADAPPALESVTVGGLPLEELTELAIGAPVDVTWNVGARGDLVVVELAPASGAPATLCAFADEAGVGSVPAGVLERAGSGRFAVHRVRRVGFAAPGVDDGQLRFDFERVASVTFTE
ncbi:MAG: hypothetical protein OZ921_20680 [Sorangiineae bacterium]|nr:hypothetical protein [Polyangiaceae bacterium]MEB2324942.1 hypothetical protein [Sorangiineae bacterium]